jgi:copper chaperone CopZ
MRSVKLQTNLCQSSSCNLTSEVICRHCSQQYCQLCFMCHRKNIIDDMQLISEQMSINRHQGVAEVISFIDKQAKDAHEQAKKLVDDAIDRIVKASKNIYTYIENRRQAKLGRLDECLEKFDKDAELLNSKIQNQIFLPADTMLDLRRKYAYNMFDKMISNMENTATDSQRKNEVFFDDYRYYHELINLRQKWTFLQAALTTVYVPAKKDISLDKILTFLEYRHDRVLENYRDFLSTTEDSKELSLKPAEDLLHELSFLSKKKSLPESDNFSYITEALHEIHLNEHVKQENEITPKTDSGHGGDDDTNSSSSQSWQIEDGDDDDDYDTRFMKLSHSMQQLEKQFENDLRPFLKNEQIN